MISAILMQKPADIMATTSRPSRFPSFAMPNGLNDKASQGIPPGFAPSSFVPDREIWSNPPSSLTPQSREILGPGGASDTTLRAAAVTHGSDNATASEDSSAPAFGSLPSNNTGDGAFGSSFPWNAASAVPGQSSSRSTSPNRTRDDGRGLPIPGGFFGAVPNGFGRKFIADDDKDNVPVSAYSSSYGFDRPAPFRQDKPAVPEAAAAAAGYRGGMGIGPFSAHPRDPIGIHPPPPRQSHEPVQDYYDFAARHAPNNQRPGARPFNAGRHVDEDLSEHYRNVLKLADTPPPNGPAIITTMSGTTTTTTTTSYPGPAAQNSPISQLWLETADLDALGIDAAADPAASASSSSNPGHFPKRSPSERVSPSQTSYPLANSRSFVPGADAWTVSRPASRDSRAMTTILDTDRKPGNGTENGGGIGTASGPAPAPPPAPASAAQPFAPPHQFHSPFYPSQSGSPFFPPNLASQFAAGAYDPFALAQFRSHVNMSAGYPTFPPYLSGGVASPRLPLPQPLPQPQPLPLRGQDPAKGMRSMVLEEFRSHKTHNRYTLKEIYGHVVEFSGDQHGSRFIQSKLETANSEEKEVLFKEIEPNALQLMKDVFGNYVIQKFFAHGNQIQKRVLAGHMRGKMVDLSLQMYACRVVQKALEHVLVDQQAEMARELEHDVLRVVKDQNGNHVVQKVIELVPRRHIGFVVDAMRGHVSQLASHLYGCRVVQRLLEFGSGQDKADLLAELHAAASVLVTDQYGNYVAQHIIQLGKPEDRSRIVGLVTAQLLTLSRHKFASNVVEKCIQHGSEEEFAAIIAIITEKGADASGPLFAMMKDQYGNYVIQKLFLQLEGPRRAAFLELLRPLISLAKKPNPTRQITALERLIDTVQSKSNGAPPTSATHPPGAGLHVDVGSAAPTPSLTHGQNSPQTASPPSVGVGAVDDPAHDATAQKAFGDDRSAGPEVKVREM